MPASVKAYKGQICLVVNAEGEVVARFSEMVTPEEIGEKLVEYG